MWHRHSCLCGWEAWQDERSLTRMSVARCSPAVRGFVTKYAQRFGARLDSLAALGYDATRAYSPSPCAAPAQNSRAPLSATPSPRRNSSPSSPASSLSTRIAIRSANASSSTRSKRTVDAEEDHRTVMRDGTLASRRLARRRLAAEPPDPKHLLVTRRRRKPPIRRRGRAPSQPARTPAFRLLTPSKLMSLVHLRTNISLWLISTSSPSILTSIRGK